MRLLNTIIATLVLSSGSVPAQHLDEYKILNHLDNYGNLYLRNKPYTLATHGSARQGQPKHSQNQHRNPSYGTAGER